MAFGGSQILFELLVMVWFHVLLIPSKAELSPATIWTAVLQLLCARGWFGVGEEMAAQER